VAASLREETIAQPSEAWVARTVSTGRAIASPVRRAQRKPVGLAGWVGRSAATLGLLVVLGVTLGPRVLPYKTFGVQSPSMEPALPVGSLVVAVPVAADLLRVGDIITFRRPDHPEQLVTHRIARVERHGGRTFFVTRGDANSAVDGWLVPATGSGLRYAFRVPYLGYVFGGALGRLMLLSGAAVILCGVALAHLWRPRSRAAP
jgi:signal peptidase